MFRPSFSPLAVLALTAASMIGTGCAPQKPPYPPTQKQPVTDAYHGVNVTDDYRWLDDKDAPAVVSWVESQNTLTRSILDRLPARARITDRLRELYNADPVSYGHIQYRGRLFAMKYQPPKQHSFLVTLASASDVATERPVMDPNVFDATGSTAIDFYVPSLDGKRVAVSLSTGGSEDGTVTVVETATGKMLPDRVPRVNYPTGGGSLAWNRDGSGFYYTRYPQGKERPPADRNFYQQIYFHALGTPAEKDTYVLGDDFPRIAEIRLESSADGRYLLASVAHGDGGAYAHYLRGPAGSWDRIAGFSDGVKNARIGADGRIYLVSFHGAPRGEVLVLPPKRPVLAGTHVLVPESPVTITGVEPTSTRLYVTDNIGGPSQVRVFDMKGTFQYTLPTPTMASVGTLIGLAGDRVVYSTETYLEPLAYFLHDPAVNGTSRLPLSSTPTVAFGDCEVVRDSATSADGTKIPMTILRKKGTPRDGNTPAILYGYGGYAVNETPTFSVHPRLWLDEEGIYVYTNLRGGGEFGEEWHAAGKLTKKQNVFDDFIACAQRLIAMNYTNASRLAIEGGSNGGLLMGAVMTQRPDLFRAVVSHVGIYDMLRVELFPNGAFNVTEFGSVKDPEQFRALYGYSPYHHVKDGTRYPAVIMLTGDNDGRVDPANSRKMIARLQEASSSPHPILLRTSAGSGHGIGTGLSERILQDADVYTFLFDQLHVGTGGEKR
jgi:prolyl oligopeptidase